MTALLDRSRSVGYSAGPDGIPSFILSLMGKFPESLKLFTVEPICRKGDNSNCFIYINTVWICNAE